VEPSIRIEKLTIQHQIYKLQAFDAK
jgi:hypothetical protein